MESIVSENNGTAEEGPTAQIQIQVSGTGETQLVTLPLSMATAISAQGNQHAQSQQQEHSQVSVTQVPEEHSAGRHHQLLDTDYYSYEPGTPRIYPTSSRGWRHVAASNTTPLNPSLQENDDHFKSNGGGTSSPHKAVVIDCTPESPFTRQWGWGLHYFNPDAAKSRRELLSRRPSYRKILNELSGQPDNRVVKEEAGDSKSSDSSDSDSGGQISVQPQGVGYQGVTGAGVTVQQTPQTIQIAAPSLNHDQNSVTSVGGIQTFSMANALAQGQATLVQGDGGSAGNTLWMPTNHIVVPGDNQMYQIRTPTSAASIPGVVMAGSASMQSPQQMAEEASRKRELRLMKNREAAKECRRRKKEYVKCLETRVTVLENQNKQLIDELKTLKELYVHKQVD